MWEGKEDRWEIREQIPISYSFLPRCLSPWPDSDELRFRRDGVMYRFLRRLMNLLIHILYKTAGGGLECWLSKPLMEPVNLSGSLWVGVTSRECDTLLPSLNWASAPCPLMLQLSNWHWPYRHVVVRANGAGHTSCSSADNRHHRVSVWLGKYHLSVRMSPWHGPLRICVSRLGSPHKDLKCVISKRAYISWGNMALSITRFILEKQNKTTKN